MKLKKVRRIVLATAVACLAGTGTAQAACPTVPVSQAFKQFGDSDYYSLVPGGGFESGMAPWALNGNAMAAGNESFFVRSTADTGVLKVKAKGTSVSPSFCVDAAFPTLRLFGKKLTSTTGQLKVEILYRASNGDTKVSLAGMLAHGAKENYSSWKPSNILKLGTALPMSTSADGTMSVQLRVTADKGGDWLVDDIYADPRLH